MKRRRQFSDRPDGRSETPDSGMNQRWASTHNPGIKSWPTIFNLRDKGLTSLYYSLYGGKPDHIWQPAFAIMDGGKIVAMDYARIG